MKYDVDIVFFNDGKCSKFICISKNVVSTNELSGGSEDPERTRN